MKIFATSLFEEIEKGRFRASRANKFLFADSLLYFEDNFINFILRVYVVDLTYIKQARYIFHNVITLDFSIRDLKSHLFIIYSHRLVHILDILLPVIPRIASFV
jgi:hypothetical protein